MTHAPVITVVCTANVCRSVLAADLVGAALAGTGIRVASAGTRAASGSDPCAAVVERVERAGRAAPTASGRRLTAALVDASDLVLTLDSAHRGEVGRLVPAARGRTFTLVEAVTLAEALPTWWECPLSFAQWRAALATLRGRVPMPTARAPRTGGWRRPAEHVPAIDIADGHTSGNDAEHRATLDQVTDLCERLTAALTACLEAPAQRQEV